MSSPLGISDPGRVVDVLGVGVSVTSPTDSRDRVRSWIVQGRRNYVCLTPVSGVMAAQRDESVMRALNGAGVTAPDGMPMVWSGRYAGATEIERVYGPDLMLALCADAAREGWRVFLYGGGTGVVERLKTRLEARFPGIAIVGAMTPPYRPLTDRERGETADAINASGADLVWVGLSTPKQDLWMSEMIGRLEPPVVLLGVGAAFDIHAGLVNQPPAWLGPPGLFWLYRLIQEPRRLWKRYAVDIPQFMFKILRDRPYLRNVASANDELPHRPRSQ